MSTALSAPADVLLAAGSARGAASTADLAKRQKIAETAQNFEASFLSAMMAPMFNSLQTDGLGGGGRGEEMFRSFLVDAISKQTAKSGGIGVADTIQREMLKLQGLTVEGTPHGA